MSMRLAGCSYNAEGASVDASRKFTEYAITTRPTILVTSGAGYIGSHVVVLQLAEVDECVVVLDDLSAGFHEAVISRRICAQNAALRAQLTPSGRGNRPATDAAPVDVSANEEPRSPEEKRRAMTWAQRLKRVFGIEVEPCVH
jgi:NAD(P)-dependent dehydrogenase (short-subunit alcohol dehydrogenase family)